MPLPPAYEDELVARLLALIEPVEAELNAELVSILDDARAGARRARLRALLGEITRWKRSLRTQARQIIAETHTEAWAAGAEHAADLAGYPWQWTQAHRQAVAALARDTFEEVLAATNYLGDDVKALIRSLGSRELASKYLAGKTAIQSGVDLEAAMRRRGLGAVTYKDGSVHSLREYARMLMRTKSALGYNYGGLGVYAAAGVEVLEIVDGSDCGLTSHGDSSKANGLVVDLATAGTYPIAHPNCRRDFLPRLDLSRSDTGVTLRGRSLVDPASRADQTRFERWFDQGTSQRAATRRRRERSRARRQGRTTRAT